MSRPPLQTAGFLKKGDVKRATMELDEAITLQMRQGRVEDAQEVFERYVPVLVWNSHYF
jgi:hypothetical protein